MGKMKEGLSVIRYDDKLIFGETSLEEDAEGDDVSYSAMQHHYKECLEHGNTLEEAIELMENKNGR